MRDSAHLQSAIGEWPMLARTDHAPLSLAADPRPPELESRIKPNPTVPWSLVSCVQSRRCTVAWGACSVDVFGVALVYCATYSLLSTVLSNTCKIDLRAQEKHKEDWS